MIPFILSVVGGYLIGNVTKDETFAKGGGVNNRVYIDFLNKKKNFKLDRKYFDSYEKAREWALKNFERFDPDFIKTERN